MSFENILLFSPFVRDRLCWNGILRRLLESKLHKPAHDAHFIITAQMWNLNRLFLNCFLFYDKKSPGFPFAPFGQITLVP